MSHVRSRRERTRPGWLTLSYLLGGVLLLYYVVPLAALVVAQPPAAVAARLTRPDVVTAVTNSVVSASLSTAVATTLGLPLAYWLARTDFRWRNLVGALTTLPLVLPPVVSGMVLLLVVGPNTPVGSVAASLGVPLTRSLAGVVLAQTFVASPFVVVTAKAAFEDVPRSLERAARIHGSTPASAFKRVILPLAWPGILAGTTLAFARSLGEFGATIMLAYYPRTMPVQIWVSFTTLGLENAFPVAVVLVTVAVATLAVLTALGRLPAE